MYRERALTSRNDVINNQHLLPRLDRISLHLEEIRAILLHVLCRLAGAGELAPLADRHKRGAQTQRKRRTEQEAARVQADNDVGLLGEGLRDVQLEGVDERLEQAWVREDGQDVLEQDARGGEVGELAQCALEFYFKIGEFGGGGGTGGGESSLGGIALERGVGLACGRVGSGGLAGDWRIHGSSGVDGVSVVGGGVVGGRHGEGAGRYRYVGGGENRQTQGR